MRLDLSPQDRTGLCLHTALALCVGLAVYLLWPLTGLPRLGREEAWFSLGWVLLLVLPEAALLLAGLPVRPAPPPGEPSLTPRTCRAGALLAGGLFVALLIAGRGLGNYKLWLGAVYLGAIGLRLAGLSLQLRQFQSERPGQDLRLSLAIAGLTCLAGVLTIPWVRPDLAAAWPPPLPGSLRPLASCLLWGGIVGAVFLNLRLWGLGSRAAWLAFLVLGLGPGPALAASWFRLLPLTLALLLLAGLSLPRLLRPPAAESAPEEPPDSLTLYWLLRALLLLWWGAGAAFTLALAWWQPRAVALFSESVWLRGVGLGAFLVACAGLLAEYSLPLLGRPEGTGLQRYAKAQGIILSCLALLATMSPLLLARQTNAQLDPARLPMDTRAELLSQPQVLDPDHPEIMVKAPTWLTGVTRVFVVSLLAHGSEVAQGQAVAQLVATDDQDIPHIFSLRAGVDTSEWALAKRAVATSARHGQARVAQTWQVFEPTGEAFQAHTCYTGLFLGSEVHRIKTITVRYLYQNPPDRHPVTLEVRKLILN